MGLPTKQYAEDAISFLKGNKRVQGAINAAYEKLTETVWQRPRSVWQAQFENALWIVIKAYKITSQAAIQRGSGIKREPVGDTFKFLAPLEILETLNHEWAEYDSLATRLAQKIATAQRDLSEGGQALQGLTEEVGGAIGKWIKGEGAGGVQNVLSKAAGRVEGISVKQRKVDAALVYTNSGRRTYQFTFNLVDEGNPSSDIVEVVNKISRFSCAKAPAQGVDFENPYIFEVTTEPNQFLVIKNAALESVQPTYKSPYRDGYPTACELTLSFKDLDPLYRNNLNVAEGRISVSSNIPLGRITEIPLTQADRWTTPYADRFARELRDLANKIPGGIKTRTLGELSDNLRNIKSKSTEKAYQKISDSLHGIIG
jgi:hypothetical protein